MSYPDKIGFYRDGLYRRAFKTISTATSRVNLHPEDSGMHYFVPTWTTGNIILPKISSKWLGIEYTFFIEEQETSNDVKVRCDVNDANAALRMNYSSNVDTHTTIIPGSTFATGLRVTAVSSIAWMAQPISANAFSDSSDASSNLGGWTTG